MSSYKLPFGLVLQETAIVLLFLVDCLLLLCYVFVVCHKTTEIFSVVAYVISYQEKLGYCRGVAYL